MRKTRVIVVATGMVLALSSASARYTGLVVTAGAQGLQTAAVPVSANHKGGHFAVWEQPQRSPKKPVRLSNRSGDQEEMSWSSKR